VVAILAALVYLFGFLSITGNRGRFSVPKFSNKIK
jgi:hypothetical protein